MEYNQDERTLDVTFCSGSTYKYFGVPGYVATDVVVGDGVAKTGGSSPCGVWYPGKNPSIGAAFNEQVKNKYPYERIS